MPRVSDRAENELVEANQPARDSGAKDVNMPGGGDYEYDEAHQDVPAGPSAGSPLPHHVDPPKVDFGSGGDYGYDEAHDFGAS